MLIFIIFLIFSSMFVISDTEKFEGYKLNNGNIDETTKNTYNGIDTELFEKLKCPCTDNDNIEYALGYGNSCFKNDVYGKYSPIRPNYISNQYTNQCECMADFSKEEYIYSFIKHCNENEECIYGKCYMRGSNENSQSTSKDNDDNKECGNGIIEQGEECDDGTNALSDIESNVIKIIMSNNQQISTDAIKNYINNHNELKQKYDEIISNGAQVCIDNGEGNACIQCKCQKFPIVSGNDNYDKSQCGNTILEQPPEECDESSAFAGLECNEYQTCDECKCVNDEKISNQNIKQLKILDVQRIYSLFPSGGFNIFDDIYHIKIIVPSIFNIKTNYKQSDIIKIMTEYDKGILINLQKNENNIYSPQINNYKSDFENKYPAILIKPLIDQNNDKNNQVYDAKIILRNVNENEADIIFIANKKIWPSLVNLAETFDDFKKMDENNWEVFVRLLHQNLYDAGVNLILTASEIANTGTYLSENKDYRFTTSRTGENSFTITTTFLNQINQNAIIIATINDDKNNVIVNFEPRLIEDEGIYDYEHPSIYETFGSNPFKVDIKILVQKEPSSFDSVINKIKQSTYPSRLDDMVYSVLK